MILPRIKYVSLVDDDIYELINHLNQDENF